MDTYDEQADVVNFQRKLRVAKRYPALDERLFRETAEEMLAAGMIGACMNGRTGYSTLHKLARGAGTAHSGS